MKKSCKSGQIRKKSYKTKRGTHVRSTCIKDKGLPGKGPKILPKPKSGLLEKYGYKDIKYLTHKERENILEDAARHLGYKDIIKHLTLIHNLLHRSNPEVAKIIKRDQERISELYKKH